MTDKQKLSSNFIIELFKASITDSTFLEIIKSHLEFQFLPNESYKKIWKFIIETFELTNDTPSIGVINEKFKSDQKVIDLLVLIKKEKIPNKKNILVAFENFIKEMKFISLYREIGALYLDGDQDKALSILKAGSEDLSEFSLSKNAFATVFKDFESRQEARKKKVDNNEVIKVPFGIHPLDYYTRGGGDIGTSFLLLGRSGAGKSTLLKWIATNAARDGLRVVHFQCEGTELECLNAYDACWTSADLEDIEFGIIRKEIVLKVKEANKVILNRGGEIHVIASDKELDAMTIEECDQAIEDIENQYGKVHLVIFDYLELFQVKGKYYNTEAGERKRREDIANKITNIAVKRKCLTGTATQANDIKSDRWNNPDVVMTRSDISEFKGALKPFSYFITINQTQDEYEAGVIRLYNDKLRKYKAYQTYMVAQSLSNSRFYDSHKTLLFYWDASTNTPRKIFKKEEAKKDKAKKKEEIET